MTLHLAKITPTLCALASVSEGLEQPHLEAGYEIITKEEYENYDRDQ